jgi:hypothetical protein
VLRPIECAIAYWGIALSLLYNPHAPPPPDNLPSGWLPSNKEALGAKTGGKLYRALLVFTRIHDRSSRNRVLAISRQRGMAQRYASDDEAQIA